MKKVNILKPEHIDQLYFHWVAETPLLDCSLCTAERMYFEGSNVREFQLFRSLPIREYTKFRTAKDKKDYEKMLKEVEQNQRADIVYSILYNGPSCVVSDGFYYMPGWTYLRKMSKLTFTQAKKLKVQICYDHFLIEKIKLPIDGQGYDQFRFESRINYQIL